jgi:ribose-phosphate pyrophosphokinase
MKLCVLTTEACRLGQAIASAMKTPAAVVETTRFPDGEVSVEVPDVRNADVFVVQSTSPPVNDRVIDLVLILDACRRGGAARVTAVVPYFGYARQDRTRDGGALGGRVVASMIGTNADRVIVVDPHSAALEGMMSVPLTAISALPALAAALSPLLPDAAVIVAPDIGAAKLAEGFAQVLKLPYAIVHKTRISGMEVRAGSVIGDVRGRTPVIVDDMISTAATVVAAFHAARAAGAADSVSIVATHGLFSDLSEFHLKALPLRDVFVTDTIDAPSLSFPLEVVSVAPLIAECIRFYHRPDATGATHQS